MYPKHTLHFSTQVADIHSHVQASDRKTDGKRERGSFSTEGELGPELSCPAQRVSCSWLWSVALSTVKQIPFCQVPGSKPEPGNSPINLPSLLRTAPPPKKKKRAAGSSGQDAEQGSDPPALHPSLSQWGQRFLLRKGSWAGFRAVPHQGFIFPHDEE